MDSINGSLAADNTVSVAGPLPRAHRQPVDITAGKVRSSEHITMLVLRIATLFSAFVVVLVVLYVLERGLPAIAHSGMRFLTAATWDVDLENAWSVPEGATFGAWPLILGTLLTTLGALSLTLILGLGCSVVLVEFAPAWIRVPFETVVKLLAGIPSVVFGLVGFTVLVPAIARLVPADAVTVAPDLVLDGQSLLAGTLVLALMIMPFFVLVTSDALKSVPRPLVDGGRALGLSRWRTLVRVQLPVALPGIAAGAVLAVARGIGEAIALSMTAGALAAVPSMEHGLRYFMLTPVRTLASAIVETGGEAASIPSIQGALFGLAALLLISSTALSIASRFVFAWSARRMQLSTDRSV